jgi:hypothetical protein
MAKHLLPWWYWTYVDWKMLEQMCPIDEIQQQQQCRTGIWKFGRIKFVWVSIKERVMVASRCVSIVNAKIGERIISLLGM